MRLAAVAALGPTPDPVPAAWLQALVEAGGITQGEAARLVHVLPQSLRRWVMDGGPGARACPWAAAELLRRMLMAPRG